MEGSSTGRKASFVAVQNKFDSYAMGQRFQIITSFNGFNAGRIYYLRATENDADEWVKAISEQRVKAKRAMVRQRNIFVQIHRNLTKLYRNKVCESFFAFVIVINFLANIAEAELLPEPGSKEEEVFRAFEILFTSIFSLELTWQGITLWFWPLFRAPIFWADAAVVSISVAAAIKEDLLGGVGTLRAIRIIRILRIFNRLESLKVG